MRGARPALSAEGLEVLGWSEVPGRETWEAFWDGGPRNKDGGGSRSSLGLAFGDWDILACWNVARPKKLSANLGRGSAYIRTVLVPCFVVQWRHLFETILLDKF
jgi:hypothetical protein